MSEFASAQTKSPAQIAALPLNGAMALGEMFLANAPQSNKAGGSYRSASEQRQDNLTNSMVRWTRAVAIFTLFLVITSALSDIFIYEQYRVANESATDVREQLRAVVGYEGELILSTAPPNISPSVYIFSTRFHNYGNTRTSRFEAWSSIHYFPGSIPNSQDFSKAWDPGEPHKTIISPNSDTYLPRLDVSEADAANALQGRGVLVIWGHAKWADIFHPSVVKDISFCDSLIPTLQSNGRFTFQNVPLKQSCSPTS